MGNIESIASKLKGAQIPCPMTGKPVDIKAPASIMEKASKLTGAEKLTAAGKTKIPLDFSAGKIANPIPIVKKQSFFTRLKNTKLLKSIGYVGNKIRNGLKVGLGKIGKIFKGKGGKIGLMVAAGAALLAGGKYLYDKYNEPKATTPQENTTPNYAEEEFSPDEQAAIIAEDLEAKQDNTRVAKQSVLEPIPVAEKEPENVTEPVEETPTVPTEYEVKKGDNVWNIAKQHLKDLSDDPNYKPTDTEILKHTKELIELNGLKYEPDGYHVLIKPKDTIKFVA